MPNEIVVAEPTCTLQDLVSRWLEENYREGSNTSRVYSQGIAHFESYLEQTKPGADWWSCINKGTLYAYQAWCLEKEYKPSTINIRTSSVIAFVSHLAEANRVANPLRKFRKLSDDEETFKGANVDELLKLIAALKTGKVFKHKSAHLKHLRLLVAVLACCNSGSRRGALCSAKLTDYDEANSQIRVKEKGSHYTTIEVHDHWRGWLDAYVEFRAKYLDELPPRSTVVKDSEWLLITATGRRYTGNDFRRELADACEKLRIARIKPHTLRHTFALNHAEVYGSSLKLAKVLGHKDPKITMRYFTQSAADLKRETGEHESFKRFG